MSRGLRNANAASRRPCGLAATSSRRLRGEEGQNLLEYAFVLVIFLATVFGIAGMSQMLYSYHFVSHAAREAARYGSVHGNSCNSDNPGPGSCSVANPDTGPATTANTVIQDYVTMITPAGINSGYVTTIPSWPTTTNSPTICATTSNASGCTVQVQVAYAYNFIFPFLPMKSSTTAPCTQPGFCLSSTSQMVITH